MKMKWNFSVSLKSCRKGGSFGGGKICEQKGFFVMRISECGEKFWKTSEGFNGFGNWANLNKNLVGFGTKTDKFTVPTF